MTPTTACGSPFSEIVRPTIAGIAAESALPQAVAEERDMLVADLVFVLGEGPADERRHP